MSYGQGLNLEFVPQPVAAHCERGGSVAYDIGLIDPIHQHHAVSAGRAQPRTASDAIHLALRCRLAVGGFNYLKAIDIETVLCCSIFDLARRPDENWLDDTSRGGFDDAPQGRLIAWMGYDCNRRGHLLGGSDQAIVFRVRLSFALIGRRNVHD
jgi:hypothetical protein